MKTKRNTKPTNKDFVKAINEIRYGLMETQSQVTNLTEVFSEFLDFTHKKVKFMEHLESKTEKLEEKT
jgi:hypothetical protein